MLGRKTYTQDELDHATAAIARQLAAYRKLSKVVADGVADPAADAARAAFEPLFFNNLVLVLDRHFVHRIRPVTGKDTNPLNEVELLADSLIDNDGVLRTGKVVKWVPEQAVTRLHPGDPIALTQAQFGRLSKAFLAEIRERFVAPGA